MKLRFYVSALMAMIAWQAQTAGGELVQTAKVTASDGAASDSFGRVAMSSDGSKIIVGASGADIGGVSQGAAYIFTRSGSSWTQQAKLTASDGALNDLFGISVSLDNDCNTAIVGSMLATVSGHPGQGTAYIFTKAGYARNPTKSNHRWTLMNTDIRDFLKNSLLAPC